MATDKDSTFQDILLELMVANETLEKIEKNTASLLPFLTGEASPTKGIAVTPVSSEKNPVKVDVTAPDPVKVDVVSTAPPNNQRAKSEARENKSGEASAYSCCESILIKVQEMASGISYLAQYAEMANTLLVTVNDHLYKLRVEIAESQRGSNLQKLQGLENTAEGKKQPTALKTASQTAAPKVDVGTIGFGKTAALIAGLLTGFVTGLVIELTKITKAALLAFKGLVSIKVTAILAPIIKWFKSVQMAGKIMLAAKVGKYLDPLLDAFDLIRTEGKLFNLRVAPLIKWFKSIQMAGKMMVAAKVGKYLDPLLDAFDLIRAEGKLMTSKVGPIFSSIFKSVANGFSKAVAGLGEWSKPIKTAFSEFFKEMKAFWNVLTDLRPEKLYRSFLKVFPELIGATDSTAVAIKTFAKKLSTLPAAVGEWFTGLKTAFNVGKSIGRVFAKLAAPLTVVMAVWDSISGAVDGFTKTQGNLIQKLIGGLKGGITGLLNGLVGGIADLLKSLVSWAVGKLGFKNVEKFLDSFSFVEVIANTINAIVDGGKLIFAPMLNFLPKILKEMAAVGDTFSILKFLPKAFNLFATVIGKIALPLQILLSVFDGVTGFIDGFTKTEGDLLDKIVGGLKGMVSGIINGLIGGLLDLVKDGISWLANAFGFGDVAKALDSFKFTDIISEMVSKFFDSIVGFFKDQFSAVSTVVSSIKDLFTGKIGIFEFVKKALAGVITSLLSPFNFVANLAGFNLTEKILDLLGLPKVGGAAQATPAIVSPQESAGTANNSGAQMTAQQNQTNDLNAAAAQAPIVTTPGGNAPSVVSTSNVSSVVYNNTNIPDRTSTFMLPRFGY